MALPTATLENFDGSPIYDNINEQDIDRREYTPRGSSSVYVDGVEYDDYHKYLRTRAGRVVWGGAYTLSWYKQGNGDEIMTLHWGDGNAQVYSMRGSLKKAVADATGKEWQLIGNHQLNMSGTYAMTLSIGELPSVFMDHPRITFHDPSQRYDEVFRL